MGPATRLPAVGAGSNISFGADEIGGYEIYEVGSNGTGTGHQVKAYWRRTSEPAPWPSSQFLSNNLPGGAADLAGATLEGGERRFEFNGVFDRVTRKWDAIIDVCAVGRAMPVRVGKRIRIRYSRPRKPVHLLTPATISKDSLQVTWSDRREKPNVVEYAIADQTNDYEGRNVPYTDPTVQNASNQSPVVRSSGRLFGVTSPGQATRAGRFEVNLGQLVNLQASFRTGPVGLPIESGDVVRVSHDLLPRGSGGEIAQGTTASPTALLGDQADLAGASWTATVGVSLGSPDPFGNQSYRLNDLSGTALQSLSQLATTNAGDTNLTGRALGPGPMCLSVLATAGSSSFMRLELRHRIDGGRFWAAFDLTSGQVTATGGDVYGEARAVQVGSWWLCWVWFTFQPAGGLETVESLMYSACGAGGENVAQQGNVLASFPTLTCGNLPALEFAAGRGLWTDRQAQASPGARCYVRSLSGDLGVADVDLSLTLAGQLPPESLFILTAIPATDAGDPVLPERGGQWLISIPGQELLLEVVAPTLNDNLDRTFTCVEYVEEVYQDRADIEPTLAGLRLIAGGEPETGGGASAKRTMAPENVLPASVFDSVVESGNGTQARLGVSWEVPGDSLAEVSSSRVWVRGASMDAADPWTLAGEVEGAAAFADVPLPVGATGDTIDVAVQPIFQDGRRQRPGDGRWARHRIGGLAAVPPEGLTSLVAQVEGNLATYLWRYSRDTGNQTVEIRRGGWTLGQLVGMSGPGVSSLGPLDNWAGSTAGPVKLYAAVKSPTGGYSVPLELSSSPVPDGAAAPDATFPSETWETFGGGQWAPAVPGPSDPTLSVESEVGGTGDLRYATASAAAASPVTLYTSGDGVSVAGARTAAVHFIEAYLEATQEHPDVVANGGTVPTGREFLAWTTEGPLQLRPDESNAEVWIEFRINRDDTPAGWGPWVRYAPGVHRLVDVQFRIRATRPSTAFGVSIAKLHTRLTTS